MNQQSKQANRLMINLRFLNSDLLSLASGDVFGGHHACLMADRAGDNIRVLAQEPWGNAAA